ncbi:MAG: hypothetical protein ABI844_14485, partial [Saprospiraceae bacterium]
MKNSALIVFVVLWSMQFVQAQEYKVPKSSGRLEIHLGRVIVENTTGNEIIFTNKESNSEKDERAVGLVAISGLGLEDNTGLGVNVSNKGDIVSVNQLSKVKSPEIKILVPKGVIVSYEYSSQYGGEATFKNLENELEVSATYNKVSLENITGPVTCKTIYSSIEAEFSNNVKGPISLISVYSSVDVTLPQAIKADLSMKTSYGEMFAAPEFKIELDRTTGKDGEMVNMSANKVVGKINGGGIK